MVLLTCFLFCELDWHTVRSFPCSIYTSHSELVYVVLNFRISLHLTLTVTTLVNYPEGFEIRFSNKLANIYYSLLLL